MLNDTWFGSEVFYIHVRGCRHLNVTLLPTHVKENLLEKLYHVGLWRVIIRGGTPPYSLTILSSQVYP